MCPSSKVSERRFSRVEAFAGRCKFYSMSLNRYEQEVLSLHRFFQEWLRGTADEADFARLPTALGPGFSMISPQGRTTSREQVVASVRGSRGKRPKMRIWIENFRVVAEVGQSAVAVYEEWQFDGTETTSRMSTAVLQASDDGQDVTWTHLHETWFTSPAG